MPIDNFKLVRDKILSFDNKGDFFLLLVLKRRKDNNGVMIEGVNEDNRLIKHFFIHSTEYFDRKTEAIKNLCNANNARAYILPQRRSSHDVLWSVHDKVSELLKAKNAEVHFDHLIRSCVAGCHKSNRKRWVIDIDRDSDSLKNLNDEQFNEFVYDVIDTITEIRRVFGQDVSYESTVVPTPHGCHIVTEPFNKAEMNSPQKVVRSNGVWNPEWIKEDGMTVVYSNIES